LALNRASSSDSRSETLRERIYQLFSQRLKSGWLINLAADEIDRLANQKLGEFTQSQPDFISIDSQTPHEFIAQLMAGCQLGLPIFLTNPHWGTEERSQFAKLTAQVDREKHQHLIMIPTGGSSGQIKFAIHTWETLSTSVWGFQEFYAIEQINSVCVLPLYHVSGLMQLCRSLLTDGKLIILDFQQLCQDRASLDPQIKLANYFISLVPTQLQKLLDLDPQWLAQFQTILLGGAPPSVELLTQARLAHLPIALTYGMTETASQITSLKPSEFLAGNNSCGRVLPHAAIQLSATCDDGSGLLQIRSKSLMLGYFPDLNLVNYFEPDDVGIIDDRGYLTILGRNSGKIITGGENVLPIEIIHAILATGLVRDVWVVGVPDRYWGQKIVAVYVPIDPQQAVDQLIGAIMGKISKYKIPKTWIQVTNIPRNSVGKVLIPAVMELATTTDPAEKVANFSDQG
jgi:o-succinylbenzoate---CoA ligase